MLENDMFRAMLDERIAQSAVLRESAAPAPVTAGRVRVWGPRASRRPSPDPSVGVDEVWIPGPRGPQAAADAAGAQRTGRLVVEA